MREGHARRAGAEQIGKGRTLGAVAQARATRFQQGFCILKKAPFIPKKLFESSLHFGVPAEHVVRLADWLAPWIYA